MDVYLLAKLKPKKVSEVSSSVCPLQVKALYTDAISDRKLLSHYHLHSIIRIHRLTLLVYPIIINVITSYDLHGWLRLFH